MPPLVSQAYETSLTMSCRALFQLQPLLMNDCFSVHGSMLTTLAVPAEQPGNMDPTL